MQRNCRRKQRAKIQVSGAERTRERTGQFAAAQQQNGVAGKQPTSKSAAGRTWWEARCRGSPFLTPVLDFLNAWNCFQLRNIKHHGFCKFVVFFLINLELIWLSLGSSGKSKVSRES